MDNSDMFDEKQDVSTNAYALSKSSFKGSDAIGNESVFYEKFLLDDFDNYWDELTDSLTVSRMVSDCVTKGLLTAVIEESAEKLASKEAEITILNEKLRAYDDNLATDNISALHDRPSVANVKLDCIEELGRLRHKAEVHIQKLKEDIKNTRVSSSTGQVNTLSSDRGLCTILPQAMTDKKLRDAYERVDALGTIVEELFKEVSEMLHAVEASAFEQQRANKFNRQIDAIEIHSSARSLHADFEMKLYEHRSLISMLNKNWQKMVNELSSMREDLDSISQTLSSSESGLLSYNSLDNFDERNTSKRKDNLSSKVSGNHHLPCTPHNEENGSTTTQQSEDHEKLMLEVAYSYQLKHMNRDELAAFYKTEMIKMRRQHDSALQEKTEEIFKLKRDFLRDKGPLLFKKDKELELLKKKIPEVILKLDVILSENEKFPIIQVGHADLSSLKDNIDTLHSENQQLRDLLREKTKEVNNLSLQISDGASQISYHSSAEAKFLHQIKKLKGDLKELKLEVSFQNELYSIVLKEVIGEKKCAMEDIKIDAKIVQDVYAAGVRGLVCDCILTINAVLLKYFTEKSSLKILLCEKENALCMEVEEKRKLKKYALETGSTLMQQKEQFELLNQEVGMLREQLAKQEVSISNNKAESDSIKRRLDQALQQIHQSEMEVKRLNEELLLASNALEEARRENTNLHRIIEHKENKLLSSITKEKQAKLMDSIAASTSELSKASIDFENKLAEKITRNETRLKNLSRQCRPLVQQANLFSKRALVYKQMLDIRSSNLQKAEAEVDLLGDEVDSLLCLLGKIYVALDHYSPVLQHYSGVMEILKLVQRELEGETTRPL